MRIDLKPVSVNQCYRGRRFATPLLTKFKRDVSLMLKKKTIPEGKLTVTYDFGVSSKSSDLDNCIKVFQDAVSEFYGFNDKKIYQIIATKIDVPKGKEYIFFDINKFE